jgi:hypothetical protein
MPIRRVALAASSPCSSPPSGPRQRSWETSSRSKHLVRARSGGGVVAEGT